LNKTSPGSFTTWKREYFYYITAGDIFIKMAYQAFSMKLKHTLGTG
jgi:hypothetical protein